MARKVDKKKAPAVAATEQSSVADDLAVLHPEVRVTIAGRKLLVREYEFFEGLEVAHRASAFIADMLGMCADGTLRYASIRRLFGVHRDVVIDISAQAAEVDPSWVKGLSTHDAELFLSTWFTVNTGFFRREAAVEIEEIRHRQQAISRTMSSISLSASPQPASATSIASGDSPSDS